MLGTTTFTPEHVCEISFRLLNIFEKLWHEERIALDREEEKQKQNKLKILSLVNNSLRSKTDDLDLAFQGHWRSNWLRYPIRDLKVNKRVLQ